MPVLVPDQSVYLLGEPSIDWTEVMQYFDEQQFGEDWVRRVFDAYTINEIAGSEALIELAARRCYRSFQPGLNANITRVREDSAAYFDNIMQSKHGSVLEHGMFTFGLEQVSRVFTHELVRQRAGTAVSQESMRYVRLTTMPFWMPEWAREDPELMERTFGVLEVLENHQRWMSIHFGLEESEGVDEASPLYQEKGKNFAFKKFVTSFMRRTAPDGVATGMIWSANARALRFIIALRTAIGAEEEIRNVFGKIAVIMIERFPLLFGDLYEAPKGHEAATDGNGEYVPGVYISENWKV